MTRLALNVPAQELDAMIAMKALTSCEHRESCIQRRQQVRRMSQMASEAPVGKRQAEVLQSFASRLPAGGNK
jgi:hypothetical protein